MTFVSRLRGKESETEKECPVSKESESEKECPVSKESETEKECPVSPAMKTVSTLGSETTKWKKFIYVFIFYIG